MHGALGQATGTVAWPRGRRHVHEGTGRPGLGHPALAQTRPRANGARTGTACSQLGNHLPDRPAGLAGKAVSSWELAVQILLLDKVFGKFFQIESADRFEKIFRNVCRQARSGQAIGKYISNLHRQIWPGHLKYSFQLLGRLGQIFGKIISN